MQVLVHVATRLRDMHAAGYVHRDIKPGNIMLLPRKNSWTIIDFGCAARTGEPAPLSFTMQYSAPEVIRAYLANEKSIVASEAMDSWSMGVVAFELLTGGNAFSFVRGSKQQQVCRSLAPSAVLSSCHLSSPGQCSLCGRCSWRESHVHYVLSGNFPISCIHALLPQSQACTCACNALP
ncbi:MAG: protein kinase [Akkermansiaceae bacterium]|nr:protein kinase [Akkermansiaceae bacterium]